MSRSVSYPNGAVVAFRDVSDMVDEFDWEWFLEDVKGVAHKAFPSMEETDKWLDREDHAILENQFAYIGVSEYCGLASVWLVVKDFDTYYDDEQRLENLSENWVGLVENKFHKLFGELRKVATFSNGESVYERM